MNRSLIALAAAATMMLSAGCATKKYVRQQAAPIINQTNELDDLTAKNSRDIKDVDARAQKGIADVNTRAAAADQKAVAAGQAADQANQLASAASTRVESLTNTVANLDNYRPVAESSVHFAFNSDVLTSRAKKALDELAANIPNTKGYLVVVEGGTDSVGGAQYNYELSERRADNVIQYLATKYDVPAHKIYVIGLGKDKTVASNRSASGRAKNRRVDVRLMTNVQDGQQQPEPSSAAMSVPQQPQR